MGGWLGQMWHQWQLWLCRSPECLGICGLLILVMKPLTQPLLAGSGDCLCQFRPRSQFLIDLIMTLTEDQIADMLIIYLHPDRLGYAAMANLEKISMV